MPVSLAQSRKAYPRPWEDEKTSLLLLSQFNLIDAVPGRSEIKFMSIFGGKKQELRNKSCKICHMILFVFHFPAIWSVTLNKP